MTIFSSPKFRHDDLTDRVFGHLQAAERAVVVDHRSRSAYWLCYCDCGNMTVVRGKELRNGLRTDCGCGWRSNVSRANTVHGLWTRHRSEYETWTAMKQRCHNPNAREYEHYGGRGIIVCDAWRSSFKQFMADMGPRPPGYWLERKENDGPYAAWNCIWTTPSKNLTNKRWPNGPRKAGLSRMAEYAVAADGVDR